MAVWMVRAGRGGEREDVALREGLAVIGWDELPDLSTMTSRRRWKRSFDHGTRMPSRALL